MSGQGLIDEAHYDLFLRWLAFGGMERGLSPLEILEMPPAMTADFQWLMGCYNKAMRAARKKKEAKT